MKIRELASENLKEAPELVRTTGVLRSGTFGIRNNAGLIYIQAVPQLT